MVRWIFCLEYRRGFRRCNKEIYSRSRINQILNDLAEPKGSRFQTDRRIYDDEGAEIHYTVEENSVYNYTTEITTETPIGAGDPGTRTTADTIVIWNRIAPEILYKLDTATLKITNSVDKKHESFGNATFIYHISGTTKHLGKKIDIFKELTLDDLKTGNVEIELPAGTYEIKECNVSRYKFDSIEEDASISSGIATIDGTTATVDLRNSEDGEHAKAGVTFSNKMEQFEKYSHTGIAVNHIQA